MSTTEKKTVLIKKATFERYTHLVGQKVSVISITSDVYGLDVRAGYSDNQYILKSDCEEPGSFPAPLPEDGEEKKCDCTHTQACEVCAAEKDIDWGKVVPAPSKEMSAEEEDKGFDGLQVKEMIESDRYAFLNAVGDLLDTAGVEEFNFRTSDMTPETISKSLIEAFKFREKEAVEKHLRAFVRGAFKAEKPGDYFYQLAESYITKHL